MYNGKWRIVYVVCVCGVSVRKRKVVSGGCGIVYLEWEMVCGEN